MPKYHHAAETCDVIFANSKFTAEDVATRLGFPRERLVVAYPGLHRRFTPDGPAADLGRPTSSPRRPSSRARTSTRCSRPSPSCAPVVRNSSSLSPDRARRSAARVCGRLGTCGTTNFRRCTGAQVLSSSHRSSRALGSRSWRRWRQERRAAVVSSHPSMDEASGDAAVRVDPCSAEGIAAGIEQALARREVLAPRGLARGAVHLASLWRGDVARI